MLSSLFVVFTQYLDGDKSLSLICSETFPVMVLDSEGKSKSFCLRLLYDLENLLDFKSRAFQIFVNLSLCSWSCGSFGPWLSLCPQRCPR